MLSVIALCALNDIREKRTYTCRTNIPRVNPDSRYSRSNDQSIPRVRISIINMIKCCSWSAIEPYIKSHLLETPRSCPLTMKITVLRSVLFHSTAAAAVEDHCGVDEVLSSLGQVTKDASAMSTLTDKADDSIASDSVSGNMKCPPVPSLLGSVRARAKRTDSRFWQM